MTLPRHLLLDCRREANRGDRRKEMIRWPQVDERRHNEGRRFDDCEEDLRSPEERAADYAYHLREIEDADARGG